MDYWQPGTTYAGGIEIVVPEPSGTLVLSPSWMEGQGDWEWEVPAI